MYVIYNNMNYKFEYFSTKKNICRFTSFIHKHSKINIFILKKYSSLVVGCSETPIIVSTFASIYSTGFI